MDKSENTKLCFEITKLGKNAFILRKTNFFVGFMLRYIELSTINEQYYQFLKENVEDLMKD